MTKTFPKTRICVIDVYSSFEHGLKLASIFAKKHNILLNSNDGKKLILAYCLKNIESTYKNVKSPFPKVLCISKKAITNKINCFLDNHFDNMINHLPIPYCGRYDLNSPDLEYAAENSLNSNKTQRAFKEFVLKNKIKRS